MSIRGLGFKMVWLPIKVFLVFFFKRRGYKDGTLGVVTCGSYAVNAFMQQAKYWEKRVHHGDATGGINHE
jgi:hypothetical protein